MFNINEDELKKVYERAKHWCLVKGFVYVPNDAPDSVIHLPFTLFPSPLNQSAYQHVFNLQTKINLIVSQISSSKPLLEKIFSKVLTSDDFIGKLWSIYEKSVNEGYNQPLTFTVIRSDYMTHNAVKPKNLPLTNGNYNENTLKQVEINTIASGFAYASGRVSELHSEILKWTKNDKHLPKLPLNNPLNSVADAFVKTWGLYNVKKAVILFIVLEVEKNIADQRYLEYTIIDKEPEIEIIRCTLANLHDYGHLDENKTLYYNNQEVAVVYFRAGYAPTHYETNKEWDALTRIELSKAIKCPNVGTFLTGMKIVQQYISDKNNLSELLKHNIDLNESFYSVTGQFFDLNSKKDVEEALTNPSKYVLKPQREGGSNNYYDSDIAKILTKTLETTMKDQFVLMERYNPIVYENYIVRPRTTQMYSKSQITSELGIYGTLVRDNENIYVNESCGYCLRSKPKEQNEAGVMHGQGCLDSIYFES